MCRSVEERQQRRRPRRGDRSEVARTSFGDTDLDRRRVSRECGAFSGAARPGAAGWRAIRTGIGASRSHRHVGLDRHGRLALAHAHATEGRLRKPSAHRRRGQSSRQLGSGARRGSRRTVPAVRWRGDHASARPHPYQLERRHHVSKWKLRQGHRRVRSHLARLQPPNRVGKASQWPTGR